MGDEDAEMDKTVVLHVYDVSLGLASELGSSLLGVDVEGVWHTGIAVFGFEYFYSTSIHRKRPQSFEALFGRPAVKRIVLGETQKSKQEFEKFATSRAIQAKYGPDTYDSVNNNCNEFCREALAFLLEENDLSAEVESILNNMKVIGASPSARMMQQLMHNGRLFKEGLLENLMEADDDAEDGDKAKETLKKVLDVFLGTRPSNASEGEFSDNLDESAAGNPNPEVAIEGILGFFEGIFGQAPGEEARFTNTTEFTAPAYLPRGAKPSSAASPAFSAGNTAGAGTLMSNMPDGTEEAARNFGRNIVEAIKLVTLSIGTAVQSAREERRFEEEISEELKVFLEETFPSQEDDIPRRTVLRVLQKLGYVNLDNIRDVNEEELMRLGLKREWAKKITDSLAEYNWED